MTLSSSTTITADKSDGSGTASPTEADHDSSCMPRYFRRAAAATHIRKRWGIACSQAYLAKLAVLGGGPEFHLAGRFPLYAPEALDAWAASKISKQRFRTTAEYTNASPTLSLGRVQAP
jgi:hypothetical protein